nr:2Fe-2S iron-sulfur cluster-binding protein [uncultured Rhodoferax sp.]
MTALHLLLIICAGLLLQVAAGVAVAAWRLKYVAQQAPQSNEQAKRSATGGAWPGWRDFRITGRQFEDASKSQCSFYLQPVDGKLLTDFKPGQYITVSLPIGATADGGKPLEAGSERRLIRCYSLSDQPDPSVYRLTIKRALAPANRSDLPPGLASNYLHDLVQVGDVLKLKAPAGQFFLDSDATVPAVFIAGGIGITPMVSMLRWSLVNQPQRAVHLFYGVRNSADHAFKSQLEALAGSTPAFTLHVVYSSAGPSDVLDRDYQHAGYIDIDLLRYTLAHCRHQFYVCGPPPMMQSLVPALRDWGVQEADIHYESFGPATVRPAIPSSNEPLAGTVVSWDVRLNRSGRTLVWDGQDNNLLDFVERQGVAVDSGCRSGSCGTCEAKLVSGAVRYVDQPDYDISPGHCLLCVAMPTSALVLEA